MEATKAPFYDYSISLTTFAALDKFPFIKANISGQNLKDNPIVIIGVLGNSKCGKTRLISQLAKEFNIKTNQAYEYNSNKPNSFYFKSVVNNSSSGASLLFIKAPSFNNPLYNINGFTYDQLLHDRSLIQKLAIGFLSYVCHIFIIVVDYYHEEDYRKYYHEIEEMRQPQDYIFVIHNLRAINPNKNIENSYNGSDINNHQEEQYNESKSHLLKAFGIKCFKTNFNNLTEATQSPFTDHLYVEKNNPKVIHFLYEQLTDDELNNPVKISKQNNTQMVKFIASSIHCYIKTKNKVIRNIIESFEEYLIAFTRQVYMKPTEIFSSKGEIKLNERSDLNLKTSDLIAMDCCRKEFMPKYSYRIEYEFVVISLEKTSMTKIKVKDGKVVSDMNVLSLTAYFTDETKQLFEGFMPILNSDNLYHGEYTFEIRIPVSYCIINNFKPTIIDRKQGIIELKYCILKEIEEDDIS